MNEILLSPMMHRDSNKHYRVPVHIVDGKHTIYVGDNHRRHFDQDTLPDVLKHKLSMINGSPYGEVLDKHEVTNIDVYTIPNDSEFSLIGWRATEELYCVVLSNDELNLLRGEKI
jgi:hypothetical protein